jgi:hypothetical protein
MNLKTICVTTALLGLMAGCAAPKPTVSSDLKIAYRNPETGKVELLTESQVAEWEKRTGKKLVPVYMDDNSHMIFSKPDSPYKTK